MTEPRPPNYPENRPKVGSQTSRVIDASRHDKQRFEKTLVTYNPHVGTCAVTQVHHERSLLHPRSHRKFEQIAK